MKNPTTVLLLAAMLGCACNKPVEPQAAAPGERWTVKAAAPGLTDLQRRAYAELGKLHDCVFLQSTQWETIEPFYRKDGNPMEVLHDMGMEVLPILVEALDDTTPTRTTTQRFGRSRVWRVNDFVGLLIRRIADREFFTEGGGQPSQSRSLIEIGEHSELIPDFQKRIQDWYAENH